MPVDLSRPEGGFGVPAPYVLRRLSAEGGASWRHDNRFRENFSCTQFRISSRDSHSVAAHSTGSGPTRGWDRSTRRSPLTPRFRRAGSVIASSAWRRSSSYSTRNSSGRRWGASMPILRDGSGDLDSLHNCLANTNIISAGACGAERATHAQRNSLTRRRHCTALGGLGLATY